jgi:hypothetical protein
MIERISVDLAEQGIIQEFVVVVYAEDDPELKKAYYFEEQF